MNKNIRSVAERQPQLAPGLGKRVAMAASMCVMLSPALKSGLGSLWKSMLHRSETVQRLRDMDLATIQGREHYSARPPADLQGRDLLRQLCLRDRRKAEALVLHAESWRAEAGTTQNGWVGGYTDNPLGDMNHAVSHWTVIQVES